MKDELLALAGSKRGVPSIICDLCGKVRLVPERYCALCSLPKREFRSKAKDHSGGGE